MIAPLILIGGLWFWLLIVAAGFTLIWTIENEKPISASFDILVTLGLLAAFSDVNPFLWIYHNPIVFAIGIAAYLVAGTIWAVVKWFFYTSKLARRFSELRDGYIAQHAERVKLNEKIGEYDPKALVAYVKNYLNVNSLPPKVVDNKGRISIWMVYWPVSAAWTILNDPIKDAVDWIQAQIAGMMQGISNNAFKKFDDFNTPS